MKAKNWFVACLSVLGILGMLLLSGCSTSYSQEELDQKITELKTVEQTKYDEQLKAANLEHQVALAQVESAKLTEKQTSDTKISGLEASLATYKATQTAAQAEKEALAHIYEVSDDLVLGEDVPVTTVDKYDVEFLTKGEVSTRDEDYKYREYLTLANLRVGISSDDAEFEEKPYLLFTSSDSVSYNYVFEESVPYEDVSEDKPLSIIFMGKPMEIVNIDDGFVELKQISESKDVLEGQTINVGIHTIALNFVNSVKVGITVDGVSRLVNDGETYDFGDIEVRVKDTLYQDYAGGVHSATLEFGKDIITSIEDGDDYSDDIDTYVWSVETDGNNLDSIGVSYTEKADDLDEPILGVGQTMNFLDYFKLQFGLEKTYDYADYTLTFDEVTSDDIPVIKVKSNGDYLRIGTEVLNTAYFDGVHTYYKDDSEWKVSDLMILFKNDDMEGYLTYDSTTKYLSLGELSLQTSDFQKFGALEDEAEGTDLLISGTEFGKHDENVLLNPGVIIKSPEGNIDNDKFVISVPNEEVKGVIKLFK